jgi:hypothetical protein
VLNVFLQLLDDGVLTVALQMVWMLTVLIVWISLWAYLGWVLMGYNVNESI